MSTRLRVKGPLNAPIFDAMESGAVGWGNLMMNAHPPQSRPISRRRRSASRRPRSASRRQRSASRRQRTESPLQNWSPPRLRLRADIYKQFPVVVTEMTPGVYAIKWHRQNLKAARDAAGSWDEYQDFEHWTEMRLRRAMEHNSSLYTLLPPERSDELMRFVMGSTSRTRTAPPRVLTPSPPRIPTPSPPRVLTPPPPRIPTPSPPSPPPRVLTPPPPRIPTPSPPPRVLTPPPLTSLNQIKERFPVVWQKVPGAPRSTYRVTLRGDYQARVSRAELTAMRQTLIDALQSSPVWRVTEVNPMGASIEL